MKKNKNKLRKLLILFLILDLGALLCIMLAYGPFDFFRNYLITTAMKSMDHAYFAQTIYNEETIDKTLNSNYVYEANENTDTNQIIFEEIISTDKYESIYEEQVLKKDENNEDYKLINIDEGDLKGYLVAIYDASRISFVNARGLSTGGQLLSKIAKENEAVIAINASGFTKRGSSLTPSGQVIQNGKLIYSKSNGKKDGGIIGFNNDNVLVLTKESATTAIKNGMRDAVEFGPFLIINGKASEIEGNGGWGIAPRTAIAQRKDGIVLLLIIEGRSSSSAGATMNNMIKILSRYKAYNAANLDGGGSSELIINNEIINEPRGYSYTGERYLPNAWIFK